MLPAVLEEHALSLLEIQENVKGEEWIHRAPRQAYGRRGAWAGVQADSIIAQTFLEVNII